jgi:hypothetical protein
MSTALVVEEIRRFLASDTAEVLCIRGRWGIGKTYAWRRYLEEMRASGKLEPQDYAYVSLFGLNSLDELRYAIFESTVPPERVLSGPDETTFQALVDKGKTVGRKGRSWLGPALSAVGLGEIGNAVARSAFLLVRNQLICLDDLERASASLAPRDVLGLVSFLKEQRNCRVVLLLNDEAMTGEGQADFRRLLEKVIDTSILFEPTASEAASIAIIGDEPVRADLRKRTADLGITNIRVIKKIERLALRLADLLQSYRPEVLDQAVAACTLSGWAIFEPDAAPSLTFLREYNSLVIAMRPQEEAPVEYIKWRDRLEKFPWAHTDDFDRVIFDGVEVGYFDVSRLNDAAIDLVKSIKQNSRESSFNKAWNRYHWSVATDDDDVLDGLRQGALENLSEIEASNLSATVRLLRECGRGEQADELAVAYAAALPEDPKSFDVSNHHFMADNPIDPTLLAAIEARRERYKDPRDPRSVLLDVGRNQGWNDEDERLLASLSADDFVTLIEATEGKELRQIIQMGLRMAAHQGAESPMQAALNEALARIAAKSPLRARRLKAWGFSTAQA